MRSRNIENAPNPKTAGNDIFFEVSAGGVWGNSREKTAAKAAIPAPQARGIAVPSIFVSNSCFAARAKSAEHTQPKDPKTLIKGKVSEELWRNAIVVVSPHEGIYAHIASVMETKIETADVEKYAQTRHRATSALRKASTFSPFAILSANAPTSGENIEPIAMLDIISDIIVPVIFMLSK